MQAWISLAGPWTNNNEDCSLHSDSQKPVTLQHAMKTMNVKTPEHEQNLPTTKRNRPLGLKTCNQGTPLITFPDTRFSWQSNKQSLACKRGVDKGKFGSRSSPWHDADQLQTRAAAGSAPVCTTARWSWLPHRMTSTAPSPPPPSLRSRPSASSPCLVSVEN